MMMKHAQTILAKVKLRIIISFRIPLSISLFVIVVLSVSPRYAVLSERDFIHRLFPLSSRVKHAWEEQDKLVLGLAFIGGWFSKALINVYKRREDWYRIHRFLDAEKKRIEETRALIRKEMKKLKELDV